MDKVALGQAFLQVLVKYFSGPLLVSPHQCCILVFHSFTIDVHNFQQLMSLNSMRLLLLVFVLLFLFLFCSSPSSCKGQSHSHYRWQNYEPFLRPQLEVGWKTLCSIYNFYQLIASLNYSKFIRLPFLLLFLLLFIFPRLQRVSTTSIIVRRIRN